jgi:hypothetical protein
MGVTTGKYLVQSIERVTGFDIRSGVCEFVVEDIQNATIANTQDTVQQLGKNGTILSISDRNKGSVLTVENGLLTDGLMAAQTGALIDLGTQLVPGYPDSMTTASGVTAVTEFTAQGTVGAEIGLIYKRNTDGSLGEHYLQAATASATEFAYDPSTKTITLPTGVFTAGENVVCFYSISVDNAKRITNDVENYSKTLRVIADIIIEDLCDGQTYLSKFVYYRAKVGGNWDIALGGDSFVHNAEFTALYSGCSTGGERILWDLFIMDMSEAA